MDTNNYQDIIEYAYKLTEEYYAFHFGTLYLNGAKIINVDLNDEKTYNQLDSWLKGIRQDYAKILVAMNAIKRIQKQRLDNTFEGTYYSIAHSQETEELSCWIDYIFTRYRSVLDYIYQVILLCVPPQLSGDEKEKYDEIKKQNKQCKFLLKHIANNISNKHEYLLDMKIFKKIVDDRDYLVHDCASCLVFSDCRDLNKTIAFKVWKKNSLEEDETNIDDSFYCIENNVIDYNRYWGLHISILIVFFDTIFSYLKEFCDIDSITESFILEKCKIGVLIDENGERLPNEQDVFRNILGELLV